MPRFAMHNARDRPVWRCRSGAVAVRDGAIVRRSDQVSEWNGECAALLA